MRETMLQQNLANGLFTFAMLVLFLLILSAVNTKGWGYGQEQD